RSAAQTSSFLVKSHCLDYVQWDERLQRHQDFTFFIEIAGRYNVACNKQIDYTFYAVSRRRGAEVVDIHSINIFYSRYVSRMQVFVATHYLLSLFNMSLGERWVAGMAYTFCEGLKLCINRSAGKLKNPFVRRFAK